MSCLGALLGATIGSFFGGPLGAIAGAVFGALAGGSRTETRRDYRQDRQQDPYSTMWGQRMRPQEHAQMTFFVGAFSILGKLASVDGQVTPKERAKVEEFIDRELRLDSATRANALKIFETASASSESFYSLANQFYAEFRTQPQFFEILIDIMLRVAAADNSSLSQAEETLIRDAVHIFRFSDARYEQLKARYVQKSSSAYAVLGCSPGDSNEQIKKAYRKLVSEYHPDKFASKGLPEEFAQVAADKFREIQAAYEEIQKERGL